MESTITIPLSKSKNLLSLLGAVAFVVLGVFFMISPAVFLTTTHRSTLFIQLIGLASVLFFGLCLVYIVKSLFDTKPGLIIDQYGITDNSNASSVGLIEWADIEGIETIRVASTRFLILYTGQPDKYIQRAKNGLIKTALQANYKQYGSPISITANTLGIKFSALESLVLEAFEKRKSV